MSCQFFFHSRFYRKSHGVEEPSSPMFGQEKDRRRDPGTFKSSKKLFGSVEMLGCEGNERNKRFRVESQSTDQQVDFVDNKAF